METILDGSRQLLHEVAEIVNTFDDFEYAIIGGWCPFLRNKSSYMHPGTLDVDVLIKNTYSSEIAKKVVQKFLDSGFIPSAKHNFQLLRPLKIKNQTFIYNVDFLHPTMVIQPGEGLYIDILDFDVKLYEDSVKTKSVTSIVQINSSVIFDSCLFSKELYSDDEINLISFDGMFLTKIDSCQKVKRERDSFDIFIAFINNGINFEKIYSLVNEFSNIEESVKGFIKYLVESPDKFNQNVSQFCSYDNGRPSDFILQKINGIV